MPSQVLSSLLKQLATQNAQVLGLVDALYQRFAPLQRRPMQQDLEDTVFTAISRFMNLYLVFDALDECDEGNVRRSLLPLINRLAAASAYIYVTSRQHPEDIQVSLQGAGKIEIKPSEEDIRAFVDQGVTNNPRARFVAQIDRETLLSKLIKCAGGM
jgi:hypothetical protein